MSPLAALIVAGLATAIACAVWPYAAPGSGATKHPALLVVWIACTGVAIVSGMAWMDLVLAMIFREAG